MSFFRRYSESPGSDGPREPALTETARERLAGAVGVFTSGLSVKEFAMASGPSLRPVAQVMGASVVRTGWQYLPALKPDTTSSSVVGSAGFDMYSVRTRLATSRGQTAYGGEASRAQVRSYLGQAVVCRLETISEAWNLARRQALSRLQAQAVAVGADLVLGVHLHRADHEFGSGIVEYVVNGTAMRSDTRPTGAAPVLSDLSVQDYIKLRAAGQEPLGLVAMTVATFGSASGDTRARRRRTPRHTRELTEISEAFQLARDGVREALRDQIKKLTGAGVVGVEFSQSAQSQTLSLGSARRSPGSRGWGRVSGKLHADGDRPGWVITMHAAGTAIRPRLETTTAMPVVETQIRLDG